ncbi:GNAT family N-acetyltransferase [Hyphomicrobium sp.]|jgi:CelD/BcsL family acetyltransferase involved in cellulose biosynthesis|uniref:GNAT family N-acetyltransferase n=1 Tax=Hyphomicrobium sp. TaxID=82 RepID=UPI0035698AF2
MNHMARISAQDPVLSVEEVTGEAGLRDLAAEWDSLHEKISPRLPFATQLWTSTWWQHFQRNNIRAKDTPRLFALRNQDGELVAVAPMVLTRRPGFGPLTAKELQFYGADSNVTELRGPLCQPEYISAVVRSISALLVDANDADWVQWRGLRMQDPSQILPARIRPTPQLDKTLHILKLPSDWNDFRSNLSRNMKEALRKCYNSLARDNISFHLRIVAKVEDTPAALDRFFALHATRARHVTSVKHPDVFVSSVSRSFLVQYCTELALRGELRIFELLIDDQVVASRIGFKFGDEIYLYYSGYDPRWGRYSIMTTVVAEVIKWAIDNKLHIVNLSSGTDISKTRWRPDMITYYGGFEVRRRYKSQALFDLISLCRQRLLRGLTPFMLAAYHVPDSLQLLPL